MCIIALPMATATMTPALPPRLVELLNPPTGLVALAAGHVESGRTWRHNERRRLPSASLIKLPILAAFWERVEARRLDPAERVTISNEARVEGTGVLTMLSPGLEPTWSDLATLMITVSDNVATNLIIDRLGMDAIQAWIDSAGLATTRIERRMMALFRRSGPARRRAASPASRLAARVASAGALCQRRRLEPVPANLRSVAKAPGLLAGDPRSYRSRKTLSRRVKASRSSSWGECPLASKT